jgi:hypothetical protein
MMVATIFPLVVTAKQTGDNDLYQPPETALAWTSSQANAESIQMSDIFKVFII